MQLPAVKGQLQCYTSQDFQLYNEQLWRRLIEWLINQISYKSELVCLSDQYLLISWEMENQPEIKTVSTLVQKVANPCDFILNCEDTLEMLNITAPKIGQSQNLFLGGVATLTPQEIAKNKISAVLTIMTEKEKKKSKLQQKMQNLDDINRHITLMCDQEIPLAPYFQSAIQFINDSFKYKMSVLIHCKEGDSKSAALVTAYIISRFKTDVQQAYNIVRSRRPSVNIKESYLLELQQSAKKLRTMK